MASLLILQGPNLNLLGRREINLYGSLTLEQLHIQLAQTAKDEGHEITFFQSNSESELIDTIQDNNGEKFIIFNPAAFTHTSIALRDALLGTDSQFIEVHLSNPQAREAFRHTSYFSAIAHAVIAGCGIKSYVFAIQAVNQFIQQ